MLTIEQLKFIRNQLSFPKSNAVIPARCAADHANELLIGEIRRLTRGPYSLSEAVASGRPFRRKAWGDDPSFCRLDKDCSSSWFDFGWQTDCIDPDDITATDYELKDGGGDAS